MNLLVDYVQPLTVWLQNNPNWSLFITFAISLTESLAIIGSIVPGSITMTAIGILAGSGIMRIDLTFLAAILGAIAGDSLSYAIGYIYSDSLTEIWPFKKYPLWIRYGKDFFSMHGGKSVLLGRFIGPLRSIIPVIAGILHMKHWRFFIANALSAVGWSFLYLMPGVIIGAASHELPPESATRLFVLILAVLAIIWLLSLMIKWLIIRLNLFLKKYLHNLWLKLKNLPLGSKVFDRLTPKNEINHQTTAFLALVILFCWGCFIILLGLSIQQQWLTLINLPIHLFAQSCHAFSLNAFFIFCTQLTSTITIISLLFLCCCWFIYHKNTIAVTYLFSLIFLSTLLALILKYSINSPSRPDLLQMMPVSSFPAMNIQVATAFYGFILFYINNTYSRFISTLKIFVCTLLGLSGLGAVYLGDYWFTDVLAAYFSGAAIGLIHCLMYRKSNLNHEQIGHPLLIISLFFVSIFFTASLTTCLNFQSISHKHLLHQKEFILNETTWWKQQEPILPLYQLSRIGKRISLFNIQYAGDLNLLQSKLEQNGWKSRSESFFTNLLMRMNKQSDGIKLPLLTQLYHNKAPSLMMTYTDTVSKLTLELRIWQTNYRLTESNSLLWIGSIHPNNPVNKQMNNAGYYPIPINPGMYMKFPENSFLIKKVKIHKMLIKTMKYPTQPYVILIKSDKPQ